MPYAKKTGGRSRFSRRKLYRRRRRYGVRRTRISSRLSTGVHYFKRTFQSTAIEVNNISTIVGSYSFKLSDLLNYTEFSNLFDEFMILGVKIKFIPSVTGADANPTSSIVTMPNLFTCIDYDSAQTPTLSEILQYPNVKITKASSIHSRYFKPHVAYLTYKTALTSGYGSKTNVWVDFENPDVPHYGLLWCLDGNFGTGNGSLYLKPYITYYFACKGVR